MLKLRNKALQQLSEIVLTADERKTFCVNPYTINVFSLPESRQGLAQLKDHISSIKEILQRLQALEALGAVAEAIGLYDQDQGLIEEV